MGVAGLPAGQAVVLADVRTKEAGEQSRLLLILSAKVVKPAAKAEAAK